MMTRILTALLLCIPAGILSAAGSSLNLDSRTNIRFTQITGPGRTASFYKAGTYITEEPTLRGFAPLPKGWSVGGESQLRFTNDQLTDLRGFSVESLSMEIKQGSHTVSLGDYFAVMSPFSMTQLLKGVGYQRDFQNQDNYFRTAWGTFDSQWEFLYRQDQNETMNRYGGGARRQWAGEKYQFGLNWGLVNDHKEDPLRKVTQEAAFYQNIGAFDWMYRAGPVTIDAEHAAGVTVQDPITGERTQKHGHANKIRLQGFAIGTRFLVGFENASINFTPLAGSASPDRRRYRAQLSRRFGRLWTAFVKFSLSHDDLEGAQKNTRTTQTSYDAGLTRSRLFGRRNLETTLTYRRSETDTRNFTRDRAADRFQLSLSDRIFRSLRVRASVEPSFDYDEVNGTYATTLLYETRISGRKRLPKKWSLNGRFSARRRDTENIRSMGHDFQNGINGSLDFSRPGGLSIGLNADHSIQDVYEGTDSRTTRAGVSFSMKPKFPKDSSVDFDTGFVSYHFSELDRDYAEYITKLSWNWRI